jgi:hypothetical protein
MEAPLRAASFGPAHGSFRSRSSGEGADHIRTNVVDDCLVGMRIVSIAWMRPWLVAISSDDPHGGSLGGGFAASMEIEEVPG